jgi:hypothetical protein|tara:strand:+ start:263 stop:457 length:195 start_codon:yes stop_codon:yes gene_type:complete
MTVEAGLSDLGSWHCLTYCQEKTLQKSLAADLLGAAIKVVVAREDCFQAEAYLLGLESIFAKQD